MRANFYIVLLFQDSYIKIAALEKKYTSRFLHILKLLKKLLKNIVLWNLSKLMKAINQKLHHDGNAHGNLKFESTSH